VCHRPAAAPAARAATGVVDLDPDAVGDDAHGRPA